MCDANPPLVHMITLVPRTQHDPVINREMKRRSARSVIEVVDVGQLVWLKECEHDVAAGVDGLLAPLST